MKRRRWNRQEARHLFLTAESRLQGFKFEAKMKGGATLLMELPFQDIYGAFVFITGDDGVGRLHLEGGEFYVLAVNRGGPAGFHFI